MLSGCELIDPENISLPSQNMKFSEAIIDRQSILEQNNVLAV
jgi:hypothetical protein